MDKKRLQELAGIEILTEGFTPVNWNNVAGVIATEFVARMKEDDESLFGEDVVYILNQANQEILEYITDKVEAGNLYGQLKSAIERARET